MEWSLLGLFEFAVSVQLTLLPLGLCLVHCQPEQDDSMLRCQLPGRSEEAFGELCVKAANILDIDGEWCSTKEAYYDTQKCVACWISNFDKTIKTTQRENKSNNHDLGFRVWVLPFPRFC